MMAKLCAACIALAIAACSVGATAPSVDASSSGLGNVC